MAFQSSIPDYDPDARNGNTPAKKEISGKLAAAGAVNVFGILPPLKWLSGGYQSRQLTLRSVPPVRREALPMGESRDNRDCANDAGVTLSNC